MSTMADKQSAKPLLLATDFGVTLFAAVEIRAMRKPLETVGLMQAAARKAVNWEAIMQFRKMGMLSLSLSLAAGTLGASAAAQSTSVPRAITRTVIAATKLSTVTDVPLYFKAVTLALGEKSDVSATNGIVYQISGSTEVSLDGETKMLNAGEGLFIASGKMAVLKAGSGDPSNFVHFFLAPAADLNRPAESAPAAISELYRTAAPIPGLKSGDTSHISGADAFQPATLSVRRGLFIMYFPVRVPTQSTARRWKEPRVL